MPPSASRGPRETQVYPSVSSTVFQGIACVQLDEHEWWLVADMQTACTPEGQSPMLAECLVASLLIPIGMPIMVALQLYSQRRELQDYMYAATLAQPQCKSHLCSTRGTTLCNTPEVA